MDSRGAARKFNESPEFQQENVELELEPKSEPFGRIEWIQVKKTAISWEFFSCADSYERWVDADWIPM